MKYQTAGAFRTALEERLRQRAEVKGSSTARLRKQVVFDRLLARLAEAAPGRWILKGALALDLRFPERSRATKDMDLGRSDDEAAATADLLAATALELPDFFVFRPERARDLDDVPEGAAVRYRVRAELAGRLFEDVIVDAGFSRGALPPADMVRGFNLLDFAGLEPIEVPVISVPRHIAEKLHAYTRTYGEGRASTRVKDLVDLALIARSCPVTGADLRQALDATFVERSSHPLPDRLPPAPRDWTRSYAAMAKVLDLPQALDEGYALAARLLDPVLQRVGVSRWTPGQAQWTLE